MSAPLNHLQKRILSGLCNRVLNKQRALARGRGEVPDLSYKAVEEFRHAEVIKAVGKHGLRCCSQDDYKAVEAHFLSLLGETGKAFESQLASIDQPRRQAEAVLWREVQAATPLGITRDYIAAICQRQFKCSLLDASEKQLWNLVYTVRNRAAAKRRNLTTDAHR